MKQKYIDFLKEIRKSDKYWAEIITSDFTEEVCRLMKKQGINRAELAEKLGSKPSYVTKILRGNVNFTLLSMTKIARALGAVIRVHLAPNDAIVEWKDEFTSANFDIGVVVSHSEYEGAFMAVAEEPYQDEDKSLFYITGEGDDSRIAANG